MTETETKEAARTHEHIKQMLLESINDDSLTTAQRDNARTVLDGLLRLEESLAQMLERGDRLPDGQSGSLPA